MSTLQASTRHEQLKVSLQQWHFSLRRWSAVTRTQRYRQRCGAAGKEIDASNPLPHLIDPITLEPVVTPAISPHGHVMGMATWKVSCLEWWLMDCCLLFVRGAAHGRLQMTMLWS